MSGLFWRNLLLWLHIMVVILTLGPLLLFDMVMPRAIRERNAAAVRFIANRVKVLGPATSAILLLGILLVLRSSDDNITFGKPWVGAAIGLYVVMAVIGVAVLTKAGEAAADKLEAGEDASAEAGRLRVFGAVNSLLFLVILWLMVAKPGS